MRSLAELQGEFIAALRGDAPRLPEGVIGRNGEQPARRFGVYRNNVHVSLVEALLATYPVVHRLVGDEFFRAMARACVAEELPRTPVLIHYGGSLPDFVARFAPAASLPYLADVARVEWAWHEAYHAPDQAALDPAELAALPETELASLRLHLHPSLRWIESPWPIHDIWETNSNDERVRPVAPDAGGQDVLVLRPDLEVEVRPLPAGAAVFLRALSAGEPLVEAADRAMQQSPGFDPGGNLQGLIAIGAFAGFRTEPTT